MWEATVPSLGAAPSSALNGQLWPLLHSARTEPCPEPGSGVPSASRVGHRGCSLYAFIREDLPPPGKQQGCSLIRSPLYCGCHCHHHSHWEEHTTLTPCVLRERAIKLAMYTQRSREKATPSTRGHSGNWGLELGEDMQGKGSGGGRNIAGATCRLQAAWLDGQALGPPRLLGFRGEPQVRNPSPLTLTLNSVEEETVGPGPQPRVPSHYARCGGYLAPS